MELIISAQTGDAIVALIAADIIVDSIVSDQNLVVGIDGLIVELEKLDAVQDVAALVAIEVGVEIRYLETASAKVEDEEFKTESVENRGVLAETADQGIIAGSAREKVIVIATVQGIVTGRTDEHVISAIPENVIVFQLASEGVDPAIADKFLSGEIAGHIVELEIFHIVDSIGAVVAERERIVVPDFESAVVEVGDRVFGDVPVENGRVVAETSVEGVIAVVPRERVIVVTTVQGIVTGRTVERVVSAIPENVIVSEPAIYQIA